MVFSIWSEAVPSIWTDPFELRSWFGSPELYEWADANPRLQMTRTEVLNDPGRIASQSRP